MIVYANGGHLRAADAVWEDYVLAPAPEHRGTTVAAVAVAAAVTLLALSPAHWSNRFQHRYYTKPDAVRHWHDDVDVVVP